ncbi:MAG: HIT domain-containing protein [Puniceicoccales bacterium]|jgi:ATP adenylyltransferase|nr:HIT domain-containing protein [Puniceicoccales bacterium]
MDYVLSPHGEGEAPFSGALSGDPKEGLLLFCDDHSFVLLNRYPYNCGHLLALPRRVVSDPLSLGGDEWAALWRTIILSERVLSKTMEPDGFNMGCNIGSAAGAGQPSHFHFHIVPRWKGDTNFMPVVGSVKVLPQALEQLYDKLRPAFLEEAGAR